MKVVLLRARDGNADSFVALSLVSLLDGPIPIKDRVQANVTIGHITELWVEDNALMGEADDDVGPLVLFWRSDYPGLKEVRPL